MKSECHEHDMFFSHVSFTYFLSTSQNRLIQELTKYSKVLSDPVDMPFRVPYGLGKLETLPRYLVEGLGQQGASTGQNFTPNIFL